jgi:hypothetical protein
MEKTVRNIADTSFFFFLAFGIAHISFSFLVAQGVMSRLDWLMFNILDLPFLLSGLIYGSTQLSLTIQSFSGKLKAPLIVCGLLSAVVFLTALIFNFAIPDAPIG